MSILDDIKERYNKAGEAVKDLTGESPSEKMAKIRKFLHGGKEFDLRSMYPPLPPEQPPGLDMGIAHPRQPTGLTLGVAHQASQRTGMNPKAKDTGRAGKKISALPQTSFTNADIGRADILPIPGQVGVLPDTYRQWDRQAAQAQDMRAQGLVQAPDGRWVSQQYYNQNFASPEDIARRNMAGLNDLFSSLQAAATRPWYVNGGQLMDQRQAMGMLDKINGVLPAMSQAYTQAAGETRAMKDMLSKMGLTDAKIRKLVADAMLNEERASVLPQQVAYESIAPALKQEAGIEKARLEGMQKVAESLLSDPITLQAFGYDPDSPETFAQSFNKAINAISSIMWGKKETAGDQPPAPGARKGKDGKWYIEKGGKYYMVEE